MKIYIANCSRQVVDFSCRVPEIKGLIRQQIQPFSQIRAVSDDLNVKQIEAIIKQHDKYGMINVTEIDRTKAFVGLCYSLDKTINVDKIRSAHHRNQSVLTAKGEQQRIEAAVAVAQQIDNKSGGAMTSVEVEILETNEDKRNPLLEGVALNENVRVDREAAPDKAVTGKQAKGERANRRRNRGG